MIRLNDQELEKIERYAESRGISVSEAFRSLLDKLGD
ncbi:hypothetical protein SAMD00079811_63100 [Scytonema sp. HK-05]|nr:DUF6290 family protein [Scytonema sp. HK-05]BAY48684.1 hypothetical protein SAMD00079811_63100 [Scytonema sp. HK-05]